MAVVNIKWNAIAKRRLQIAGSFLGVLALIFVAMRIPFFSGVAHSIEAAFVTAGTSIDSAAGRMTRKEDEYIVERDYFRDLSAKLAVEQTRVDQLERDVREMEELLKYTQTIPYNSTAARIVARSPQGMHTFTIDKGAVDGVEQYLAVVIENGHMIGYIEAVGLRSSTVKLLQHPDSRTPAMIIGTNETVGLIEGQDGFLLHMDFIPQRISIGAGDVVVTSGLDGIFPQGLVIGIIDSIVKNETAAFQEAYIKPFYDVNTFTNVLVLDPFKE